MLAWRGKVERDTPACFRYMAELLFRVALNDEGRVPQMTADELQAYLACGADIVV